jgi:hypothetical protein
MTLWHITTAVQIATAILLMLSAYLLGTGVGYHKGWRDACAEWRKHLVEIQESKRKFLRLIGEGKGEDE